ncbi:unnamed protein product [Cylicostephanus goldi]|uniref:Uncharacterized protein n=1 Tax=Cylicostephanus goldi TaxID=71465 RepID=A0A3P7P5X7_CYLGO|nr:unnamed protein product [Cylicostephanus goldi]
MVLDTVFKGTEIRPGDWFYASVKLFPDLFRGVEPIYMVKKIVDLSAPLAFTECFMNEIKVRLMQFRSFRRGIVW